VSVSQARQRQALKGWAGQLLSEDETSAQRRTAVLTSLVVGIENSRWGLPVDWYADVSHVGVLRELLWLALG
jgi:hypothetical protein